MTTPQTANERYQEQTKEAAILIKKLQAKLKKHAANQSKEPKDWGYVGDMGHYLDLLKQLTN